MTLEEKAEVYADENDICVCDEEYWSHDDLVKAYLAGAKELEQEKCELLGIIQEKDKVIEKMKCCRNCSHDYDEEQYITTDYCRDCFDFNKWELKE